MDNVAVKRRLDVALSDTNIITYTAVSIFLPYVLTTIILIVLSIYIITDKRTRLLVFIHSGTRTTKLFFVYVLAIPLLYRNWMGLAVGAAMILALILGLYLRSIMTKEFYEKILTLICNLSLTSTGYAIFEALFNYIYDGRHIHRVAAEFMHPNYFGTVAGTVVIICAYKVLTGYENKLFYIIVAGMNFISMYLCRSMFVWVEVFIGVTVLLAILHRRRLLAVWLTAACFGAYLIFFMDISLIPRLEDVGVTVSLRRQIWHQTMLQIEKTPLFGHGFMSYGFLFHRTYNNQLIPHAHSVYLDLLLNFGVVGTALFVWYFIRYYAEVFKTAICERKVIVSSLIIAVSAAALVHGVTDITLLWVQTLPLFLLVLSGQGTEAEGLY